MHLKALNNGDVPATSQATAGMTDSQTEGLKSFFSLLELSPEAMTLIQVLLWWLAIAKRSSFSLQPWCALQPVHAWGKALPCAEEPALSPVPPACPAKGFNLTTSVTSL